MVDLNVMGLLYCAHAALPHLLRAAEGIADMIAYIVTRPRHVAVNEVLIRPTEQA